MINHRKHPPRYHSLEDISATTIRQLVEHISPKGDCIIWKGSTRDGYGRIKFKGKQTQVHRWFYQIMYGKIPGKLDIDHLCRNRACLKLEHLDPVSRKDNRGRGLLGVLKTHCANGHPWNKENTEVRLSEGGIRRCSICRRISERRHYIRQKAQGYKRPV